MLMRELAVWAAVVCWSMFHCGIVNAETTPEQREEFQPQSSWNDNQRKLKVLILTVPMSGHTANPLALGEELVYRGHSVTLVTPGSKYQAAAEKLGITFMSSEVAGDIQKLAEHTQTHTLTPGLALQVVFEVRKMVTTVSHNIFKLIEAESKLGKKWDIVISTDFLAGFLPCISDYLNIPALVSSSTTQLYTHTYPPWPWPSSLIGGTNDDMTFLQRFGNAIERIVLPYILTSMFLSPLRNLTDKVCPDVVYSNLGAGPGVDLPDIVPTVIGFEFPRTITPLTHYVGPIQQRTPEPCSAELKVWLDGKKDNSVLYISMGSLQSINKEMANAFVEGIKKTKYSVVWAIRKTDDFELDLDPDRFFLNKWLPQLSVLRHRATGMAIMHGGTNGVHESLHSGVPLIVLPLMTEQVANAGRVHNHHLGIHLNRNTLSAEQITKSIQEIDSGDYRENVRTIQKMFAQAGGVEKAADLVEFYAEVGYDHLIPAYAKYQWSWVQYYNADVYAILIVSVLISVYLWFRFMKCIWSRCCSSKKHKTD